jgi:hypothetical protein
MSHWMQQKVVVHIDRDVYLGCYFSDTVNADKKKNYDRNDSASLTSNCRLRIDLMGQDNGA